MPNADKERGRLSLEAAQINLIMHRLTTARTDLGWLAHALEEGTVPHAVAKAGHDALVELFAELAGD